MVTAGQAVKKSAAQWVTANFAEASRELLLRSSPKGPLRAKIWVKEVWQWAPAEPQARRRLLVVRQEPDGTFKYSLSNAAAETAWDRLAEVQTQRFWIERAFQDAKSELGMADYEVRGWKGWHHHMALVCLALVFTVKERIAQAESLPLLSVRDMSIAGNLPSTPRPNPGSGHGGKVPPPSSPAKIHRLRSKKTQTDKRYSNKVELGSRK